ncbi:chaperone protein DNAJ [Strigomonas culicis]|uniref:Chaperone protein DNAJ n=1 Tax=Strigomonas culicis TaxID=28005 RepID=S9TKJ2_9TRYP|nr:chaperone protein DNAJ [Strigomonas culicis]|eukprot:EPY18702.1 chaperone protein DNAJ [Strigomonas culicis]
MAAMEVEINGKKQIVLVPGEELQSRIRTQMAVAAAAKADGAGDGAAAGEAVAAGPQRITRRPLTAYEALNTAVVPKSVTMRHSFVHTVSPRLAILLRSEARSEGRKASVSATAEAEYQRDSIRSYALTLRAEVMGLKSTFLYQRLLSPIWTLRHKLTLVNRGRFLDKLELTLERKLSEFTSLENTLAFSLFQYGFFRSQLKSGDNKGQQGLTTYISYHGMTVSLYTVSFLLYGIDTKDANRRPACGRVQYTVNCSPFSGQTHVGFEAWYYKSALKHYGIGFMTILPYSISPIAPPYFLVASSQFAVVNQISLLYERGQHRISIPIIALISPEISRAVLWLSVPLMVYRMSRLLYRPYARANAAKYYLHQRKEHLAEMDIAYQRALLEQRALELAVMQGSAAEDRKGGLVIINAQYGVLEPEYCDPALLLPAGASPPRAEEPGLRRRRPWLSTFVSTVADGIVKCFLRHTEKPKAEQTRFGSSASLDAAGQETVIPLALDVTIALQNLVRDSALSLPGGTKSKLVGFCDPDPYTPEKKELKITYWFQKKRHVVVYNDEDEVILPQRDHLVS